MIDFVTKPVNSRMITAFFDTRAEADTASHSLQALGVRVGDITIADGADPAETAHTAEPGFWESLKRMFLPAEDHHTYAEGLKRGGYLMSANVEPDLYDRAVEVVDSGGAINMDEREASWRTSGWEGYKATPGMESGAALGAASGMALDPALTTPIPAQLDGGIEAYDETRLGVRDTGHGSDRLRSYTMSPVADQALDYREDPAKGVFGISERFSPATDSGAIAEHMDVIASDGVKIGTVDHLDAERIKLTKNASPDGLHHFIPLASVDHVDTHVHLNKTASEAKAAW